MPHADSHAQSSAGGFTQHKHLPNEERGGANLKKKNKIKNEEIKTLMLFLRGGHNCSPEVTV